MKCEKTYRAEDVADKFGVHVKTIARAVSGNPNASDWDVGQVASDVIIKKFCMQPSVLAEVMAGEDQLIDAETAAGILGISTRRFHQRRSETNDITTAASHGRTVRYSYNQIATAGL